MQYDFGAMRFYVDCEKNSFEVSGLGVLTIYDVFREELTEMQYGTNEEKKWLSRFLDTMEYEKESKTTKYTDSPEIHKRYIIVDANREGIENRGILAWSYEDMGGYDKMKQLIQNNNGKRGDLRKGLGYGTLFLNTMLLNLENRNVKLEYKEFEKENLSVTYMNNIETSKTNILVLKKGENRWVSESIIQMSYSKNNLEPEIRKKNKIKWLVLREKETVDGKNLVKNMWFNLYTQQTDLIYWTAEGEGSKELMTDEKGEVYLQIDADINNGLINSDGAKLYYDFNCMRFYTV